MTGEPEDVHPKYNLLSDVIDFFHKDFSAYYAATISIIEKLPEQVNNEIRNAFSHLARANAADDIGTVTEECKKAKGHIERANRDCLKASLITLKKRISLNYLFASIQLVAIPPDIIKRKRELNKRRSECMMAEEQGDSGITKAYEQILLDTLAFDEEFSILLGEMHDSCAQKIVYYFCRQIPGVIFGVTASLMAALIWSHFAGSH